MDASAITNGLGAAAAVCSVLSFLPQIAKMVRARDASGVSLRTYAITVTGFALWALYGARLGAWPLVCANILALGLAATIMALKWRYGRTGDGPPQATPSW